jgi:hypothetical protein
VREASQLTGAIMRNTLLALTHICPTEYKVREPNSARGLSADRRNHAQHSPRTHPHLPHRIQGKGSFLELTTCIIVRAASQLTGAIMRNTLRTLTHICPTEYKVRELSRADHVHNTVVRAASQLTGAIMRNTLRALTLILPHPHLPHRIQSRGSP